MQVLAVMADFLKEKRWTLWKNTCMTLLTKAEGVQRWTLRKRVRSLGFVLQAMLEGGEEEREERERERVRGR